VGFDYDGAICTVCAEYHYPLEYVRNMGARDFFLLLNESHKRKAGNLLDAIMVSSFPWMEKEHRSSLTKKLTKVLKGVVPKSKKEEQEILDFNWEKFRMGAANYGNRRHRNIIDAKGTEGDDLGTKAS
jgi:hypothetical protein